MDYYREFQNLKTYEKAKVIKFIIIVICYGMQCVQFTGVPVLFYRPNKVENPNLNGPPLFDNEFPGINSIPMEYDLYGDDEIWEIYILTAGYIAKSMAYVVLMLYPIKKSLQHKLFFYPLLVIGISLCVLEIYSSPLMLVFSFIFYFGASSYFFGQVFSYVPNNFTGKIGDNYVWILNTIWSVIMLFHIIFEYFYGGWRENLIYLTGTTYLILGIALIYLEKYIQNIELKNQEQNLKSKQEIQNQSKNLDSQPLQQINTNADNFVKEEKQATKENKQETDQKQIENEEKEESSFQMLKNIYFEVQKNSDLRKNIFIWSICWSIVGVSYTGCVLALNRLKGNLFFNLIVSTVFEVFGNILSIYLIKRYKIKNVIITNLYIIGISYVSFIFLNPGQLNSGQSEQDTVIDILISLFPIIVAKATHETMWNLLLEVQKQIMDIKYQQFSFSFANIFDIGIFCSLPYYQYTMTRLGFNQFIGYGVYSLIGAFYSSKFKLLPEQEKLEEQKNNPKESIENNTDVELKDLTQQLIEKV